MRSRDELATQLDAIGWDGTQAILNSGDAILASQRRAIVDRAAKLRLPALYEDRIYVESGGLMSYGANVRDMHRRAADYVDKILKGAKPGDLPVQGRNFTKLLELRPGVYLTPGSGKWSQTSNGMRNEYNVYILNGMDTIEASPRRAQ